MKPVLVALLLLAACSDPSLYAGIGLDAGGVSVYPAASASVGGARVTVSP